METQGSLVKKIEEDFLSCSICFEPLRDPIGLPCLHGFCFECLDKWFKTSRDKSMVICPSCKEPAQVPKDEIRGFPGHFLVKNLREAVNMKKQVEKPVSCNICEEVATVHCLDCKDNLCNSCLESHKSFRSMKDHMIATVEELHSAKEMHEVRFCKAHGEVVRYYCETEELLVCPDCVSLKTCPMEHERISLKDAARKQITLIQELDKECEAIRIEIQGAIFDTEKVKQDLFQSQLKAKTLLVDVKKSRNSQLQQTFQKHEEDIDHLVKERKEKIENLLDGLKKTSTDIDNAHKAVSKFTTSESDFEIIHKHASLSKTLQNFSKSKPEAAEKALGYVKFEAATQVISPIGQVSQGKEWKLIRKFSVAPEITELFDIAFNNKYDSLAISSFNGGVKVFSKTGKAICTLDTPENDWCKEVCTTLDGRYLTAADGNIYHYNNTGSLLTTSPTHVGKTARGITSDKSSKIIIGWLESTSISIHYAEGSLISTFVNKSEPYHLAITSKGEIVASFMDASLQLMDYFGGNFRVIKAPPNVTKWDPGSICCSQGNEIFVINEGGDGNIYRFTADGEYLGLAIAKVTNARGMALSEDCKQMFVTEEKSYLVKVFQRP